MYIYMVRRIAHAQDPPSMHAQSVDEERTKGLIVGVWGALNDDDDADEMLWITTLRVG